MDYARYETLISRIADLIEQDIDNHDDEGKLSAHVECLSELVQLQAEYGFNDGD